MLAVGPISILPSPLLAVVPTGTTAPFTVQNGSATWLGSGTTGTINVTAPNSVLVWGTTAGTVVAPYAGSTDGSTFTNFNILTGETFNFTVPAGSAVLNKVSAGSNTTNAMFNGLGAAAAVINGTLNAGSGRVAILSTSGNIIVGAGAQIITGGLVLSTLSEDSSNFSFTSGGNLALATSNTSNGNIYLGSGASVATVVGNLTAFGGTVATTNLSVSGDLIINQTGSATGLVLTSAAPTTVGGNFSATSNAGTITQGAGALSVTNGVSSFATNGNVAVTLLNAANDFNTVRFAVGTAGTAGGDVNIRDANNVVLGNATTSTVGNNLTVTAAGNITTGGAVAVGNTVSLTTTAGGIAFANASSAGNLVASATGGNITVITTGNLTTKAVTAVTGGSDIAITAGNLTVDGAIGSSGNVSITATNINSTTTGSIGVAAPTPARSVTVNGTGTTGSVVLPAITTRSLNVQTAGASVSQIGTAGTNIISVTGNAAVDGAVVINAGTAGSITLNANNSFGGTNSTVNLTGNTISLSAASNVAFGSLDAVNSVTVNTSASTFGNGNVTFGLGGGSTSPVIRVGGNLTVSTNGSNVGDDPQANVSVFGAVTINTMAAGYGQLANNVTVTSNGTGFFRSPTVVITGNSGGSNATATVTVNTTTGALSAVSVTNGGGGFNTAPVFAFNGGGNNTVDNAGEAATVTSSGGFVTAVSTAGVNTTGFVAAPTVVFTNTGTGGTGAAATALIDTTTNTLIGISVTNTGSGYTSSPTFTLVGGTNNGTVAPVLSSSIIPKGDVTFTAQDNQGSGTFGQFNVTAASVSLVERTTLNLGTINAASLSARSTAGDVLINGAQNINNNGAWSARANAGNITQINGAINSGTGTVTANLNGSNGSVNLTNSSNIFGALSYNSSGSAQGNIIVGSSVSLNQLAVSGTSNISVTTTGTGSNITVSAGSFNGTATFNSAGTINLTSNNSTNSVAARNLILIAGDTSASSITQNTVTASQIINVNGTLTLSTAGGVTLNGTNNPSLGNVVLSNLTGTGEIILASRGNISSVAGNAVGTVNLTSGTVGQNSTPIASSITLGNLNVGNLVARAQNSGNPSEAANLLTNGASGNIGQAAGSSIHVENILTAVTFNGGNIVLGNNGNSAGRVQLSTAGALPVSDATFPTVGAGQVYATRALANAATASGAVAGTFTLTSTATSGNISYTEDSTAKLGALQTNGAATINSRFGSIIEDPAAAVALNVGGLLTLNAPNGSVSIGNTTHTVGATTSNITAASVVAAGSAALTSTSNLTLGAMSVNSLSVTAANITQSAPLRVFGLSSFNVTSEGGNITLNDSANNFGPLSLTAARNATISVTESSTLNLRSITMGNQGTSAPAVAAVAGNGTLTLVSVNGDIIDTGLGGVKAGGLVAPSGVPNAGTVLNGSGVVSLTAANGNIVIDDPTSDMLTSAGIVFNARNVTLSVLGSVGSTLVLGAATGPSAASGNLIATSALGNIGNAGAMRVEGLASFQTGNGNITIDQPNVGFGQLRFTGNQVRINESGAMDILTGSSAFGPAQLVAGGNMNIVVADGQSVTFGSNVALQASGNLTLRQTQVVGNLTLSHTGTANLSALSKSTDLNGRDPIDLGTGPYIAPNP